MIGNVFSKAGGPPRIAGLSAMRHQILEELRDDIARRRRPECEELAGEGDIGQRVIGYEIGLLLEFDRRSGDRSSDHRRELRYPDSFTGTDVNYLVHHIGLGCGESEGLGDVAGIDEVAELVASEPSDGLAGKRPLYVAVNDPSVPGPHHVEEAEDDIADAIVLAIGPERHFAHHLVPPVHGRRIRRGALVNRHGLDFSVYRGG